MYLTLKDIPPSKPQTDFPIQIENSFPIARFNNILKKGFIWKRFRESCAYVDSLVTSVFFLFCLNNVIFLLSRHIQRLLMSIQLLPYIYFILSFFKYQTKLPWIKTGFSHLTIDIPILAVWRKFVIIDSVHRPATSLLQLNGRASEVLIGRSQVRLLILAHRVSFLEYTCVIPWRTSSFIVYFPGNVVFLAGRCEKAFGIIFMVQRFMSLHSDI